MKHFFKGVIFMHAGGRPRKYTNVDELENKINEYFEWCDEQTRETFDNKGNMRIGYKPYTVSGLCLYLDIHTDTLLDYEKNDPKFSLTIKMAKKKVENWIEEHALMRDVDNTSAIFNLKNNFGWRDKQEIESVNKNENTNVTISDDELIAQLKLKYLGKVDDNAE